MNNSGHRLILLLLAILAITVSPAIAQAPADCDISDNTVADIRQMLTAPDNGIFFEIWTREEIACACIELYYNDPADAYLHDAVITGAVVLLGQTEDPRAVPVLIDAIDTYPPQALYNLGNFSTIDALNALVDNIQNENDEARENAAEGLRRMQAPSVDNMEDGWIGALDNAIEKVADWMVQEPVEDFRDYFIDAYINLGALRDKALTAMGTVD